MTYTLCVPCLLGLEGPIADELRRLNMSDVRAENGRVYFAGSEIDIARANICLRQGERVMIELGSFVATDFDALYDGVRALPWESVIPADGAFPVKGHSLNSQLASERYCQRNIKAAVAARLGAAYGLQRMPETGALYQIQFAIMKNRVSMCIDTTGAGLHKRGYRPAHNAAPLKETMAAALVGFSRYKGKGDFCDPFCGSGTIAIEAALIAKNRAPGLAREFTAMSWPQAPRELWESARQEARAKEFSGDYHIFASDIDPRAVALARENAERAGVADCISFSVADATKFDRRTERGIIVTNPPYGERIMDKSECERLYGEFGSAWRAAGGWKLYILSAHTEFERAFGQAAVKKRKLYNGMIKCDLFMYF
ncbi:MAG: class I SAM-dependent RNA methyltransferase [Oscillospiraceae bacterium]|nr:class I SAM-dependent RNA methyltransferase [Oscillospiraceae bacterium]